MLSVSSASRKGPRNPRPSQPKNLPKRIKGQPAAMAMKPEARPVAT
jgi:hypothetical protein